MKFSLVAVLAAAAASVIAQTPGFDAISAPTQDQTIKAGSSFEIVWEPATQKGTVTITLLQGASPSTLQLGPVVASSINNQVGKFVWKPVPDAQFATYGFKISLDSNPATFQYSFPFHIEGKAANSVSTSTKETSAASYPTSKRSVSVSYITTVSLAPGASYSTYLTTSTTAVPTYKPTYSVSPNATWVKPSGTGYSATLATNTSAGPSGTPSIPAQPGAATRFGASGFVAIAGLVLAFAM